jgi:hypothetical protein
MLLVLLLASANAGNLLLARGLAQRREIAVRLWLGAGRARVLRALLIEALLLCGAAGALALVIAFAGPRLFLYTVNNDLVQVDAFAPDAGVFLFAIAMSLVACAVAGLVPALRVTRHAGRMRDGDPNASLSGAGRVRGTLLAMQVALVMVLLVSAGLLTRSVTHALSADVGFTAIDDVRVLSIGVPDDMRPQVADMAPALHTELAAAWPSALAFSDTPVVGIDPNGLLAVRRPVLSLGAATLLRGCLYGMSPLDPLAYFQVAAILALAALVASWFPARRATRIDPAITLKVE